MQNSKVSKADEINGRDSYAKLLQDKEFEAFTVKRFGVPFSFIPSADGERIIKSLRNADPQVVRALKAFIKSAAS